MATLAEAATRLKQAAGSALPALVLMTDDARLADPLPAACALPPGSAVILRHYGAAERASLARRLAAVARRRGLVLLVGEDPALARRVGAHGVHLPERAIGRAGAVRWQRDWLITAAAHSPAALRLAAAAGADAALLSPVFATASHPHVTRPRPAPLRGARAARADSGLRPGRHRPCPRAPLAGERRRGDRRNRRAYPRGPAPPSRGMISTSAPRAAAGAWGGRTTRHCAFTSSDSIELSCFANGVATSVPFSSRPSVARR